ncbi:hypothetical protein KA183_17095 [bacterium]|nr:hypothetical protein [bacterium]QQR58128.1 MAG: hypothetical protein IPG59_01170 [Candidatus Melainabacteria bacterium]
MQAQNWSVKSERRSSLVILFGFSVIFSTLIQSLSLLQPANAQGYPGGSSGSGSSGTIYLPNGVPFQIGTNYPGGMNFPHHPNYNQRPSYAYPNYSSYRNRGRGKVSSLIDSQNAQQTKRQTTWEAPTVVDEKIDLEIESTQVNNGIDSREAMNLIWTRAKQYYEGHHYEKAAKMLDQLEPLRQKKDKLSLISDASIDKMRNDIDKKLGRGSSLRSRRSGSRYLSKNGSNSSSQPISLDSFLDPSRGQNFNNPRGGRNFYP